MKIINLYNDYHVQFATEGSKHTRDGWVNIHCPFCTGSQDYHLGFNLDDNYFHCWRCGGKHPSQAISKILSVNLDKADQIIKEYGGVNSRVNQNVRVRVGTKPFLFPSGDLSLTKVHRSYLEGRGFDPDLLVKKWGLMGTGPVARLDGINYSHRILAPIHWDSKVVSFQSRDITKKHKLKYLACVQDRELIKHQTILYGSQGHWGKVGVCVEGITDVWRLGTKAFAVFGIDYTPDQVKAIVKHFSEVVIMFDPERTAQKQSKKLMKELEARGVKVRRYSQLTCDPGDLTQDDANHLMKEII